MRNLLRSAVLAAIAVLADACAAPPAESRLLLWYDRPAQYWEEALPVGNGRIGAMVHGGVQREHIQLNEETIWSGTPTPKLADPTFREKLRRQRELIFAGKFRSADDFKLTDAEKRALDLGEPRKIPGTSTARHAYQPLGDLFLHFDHGTAREENYRRELNLDTAMATTRYSAGGVTFTREVFSSFPANALVTRVTADQPGRLSFAATLDYRRDVKDDMYRYDAELGPKVESVTVPPRPTWTHLGGNRFAWRGRGHPDGVKFDARFELQLEGGTLAPTADGFRVTGATAAVILMTVGTDFHGADPAVRAARDLDALAGQPFDSLRAAHTADHQSLFRRVELDLGRTRSAEMPTNRRIWSQMWGAPAAHAGARDYAQFVWLAPLIPRGEVRVHEDGLAPAYRSGPRFPRIKADPETVPAWRTSEIGLTSESAPTSKGARGIFLACYAPWMLRIASLTNDAFLHDIARSAIIGRYTSFPGYHLNTARNTAYEKPDFARRGKDELNSATSIHYNHIWPHIALLLDNLVASVREWCALQAWRPRPGLRRRNPRRRGPSVPWYCEPARTWHETLRVGNAASARSAKTAR